jgi:hypothetical protein
MTDLIWYGAKTVYRHARLADAPGASVYEERVVVVRAADFADALARAEAEAARYAAQWADAEYLGYVMVYDMTEETIDAGCEVFSLMRETALGPDAFLDRYHDAASARATDADADV